MNALPDPRLMKGIGRVTFMAHLAEITAELDAGRPLKAVYENRQDRLGVSYRQFTRYVAQLIRRGPRGQAPSPPQAAASPPRSVHLEQNVEVDVAPPCQPSHAADRRPRTFNHDPVERRCDRRRILGDD